MRDRIIAVVVILAIGAGVAVLVNQKRNTPEATRERRVEQFIAILPDSLGNDHILEIRQLFYTLREREKLGKVRPETSAAIDEKLAGWVDKGKIGPKELVHFMAEVGHGTYQDDSYYNPGDSVDHPILNPKASAIPLGFDSTFWAEFEQWKKDHPELVDSLTQEYYTPQRRR